jgi:hypothetical protein
MHLLNFLGAIFLLFSSSILNQCFAGVAEKLIDQKCRTELKRTEIHVFVDKPNVAYNFERDTNQLTSMKSSGTNGTILGLTVVRKEFDIKTKVSMIKLPDGSVCMRPGFDITIQLNPQKVYVANEFKQGTCAFNQIIQHEMRHVQVNQKHAEMIAFRYEREMRKAFANKIYYGSQNNLMNGLVKVIKNEWLPHLGDEIKKAEELHKKIDTEQEYRRMGTVCNREVPKILRSYM